MRTLLAQYSDWSYFAAVVIYLAAMVLHTVELAQPRRLAPTPTLVAARRAGPERSCPKADDVEAVEHRRSTGERVGRTAVSLTVLGVILHVASIVLRGLVADRWPLGNMYEFVSAIGLAAVVTWLIALRRPEIRRVGAFVLLPTIVLLFLGGTVLYVGPAPVVPALQSYWLAVHVSAATIASGLLLFAGVTSLLFVLRRSSILRRFATPLPAADVLDRVAYRVTTVAFTIWTFAGNAGANWAEAAWGRVWGWDPKETVAFVAWIVYAMYLHARATAGWRAGRAAWINVLGLVVMMFNLFFVNMVIAGLHSYAGVT